MEGFNPCCVYVTGSNSAEAIRTSSIQPKLTSHDNQGQCSVINGGNSHSIDANTQYGGIQSGYSSSLVQQCGSNIAGGLENIILPGSKGRVKANTIIGGGNNKLVELVENATPLPEFKHPENALYIFGPEDSSVPQHIVNAAEHVVYIPTDGCLNLAATANIVLYDRLVKSQQRFETDNAMILRSRDNNNTTTRR